MTCNALSGIAVWIRWPEPSEGTLSPPPPWRTSVGSVTDSSVRTVPRRALRAFRRTASEPTHPMFVLVTRTLCTARVNASQEAKD
jgi:hypothetical protein